MAPSASEKVVRGLVGISNSTTAITAEETALAKLVLGEIPVQNFLFLLILRDLHSTQVL